MVTVRHAMRIKWCPSEGMARVARPVDGIYLVDQASQMETGMKEKLESMARRVLPRATRAQARSSHALAACRLGAFWQSRRMHPISTDWGRERGQPIDRYYITRFLAGNAQDIRGHVRLRSARMPIPWPMVAIVWHRAMSCTLQSPDQR